MGVGHTEDGKDNIFDHYLIDSVVPEFKYVTTSPGTLSLKIYDMTPLYKIAGYSDAEAVYDSETNLPSGAPWRPVCTLSKSTTTPNTYSVLDTKCKLNFDDPATNPFNWPQTYRVVVSFSNGTDSSKFDYYFETGIEFKMTMQFIHPNRGNTTDWNTCSYDTQGEQVCLDPKTTRTSSFKNDPNRDVHFQYISEWGTYEQRLNTNCTAQVPPAARKDNLTFVKYRFSSSKKRVSNCTFGRDSDSYFFLPIKDGTQCWDGVAGHTNFATDWVNNDNWNNQWQGVLDTDDKLWRSCISTGEIYMTGNRTDSTYDANGFGKDRSYFNAEETRTVRKILDMPLVEISHTLVYKREFNLYKWDTPEPAPAPVQLAVTANCMENGLVYHNTNSSCTGGAEVVWDSNRCTATELNPTTGKVPGYYKQDGATICNPANEVCPKFYAWKTRPPEDGSCQPSFQCRDRATKQILASIPTANKMPSIPNCKDNNGLPNYQYQYPTGTMVELPP